MKTNKQSQSSARLAGITFTALHALRVKGYASTESVAATTGQPLAELDQEFQRMRGDELVAYREGRICGWRLTPAGTERHAQLLRTWTDDEHKGGLPGLHLAFVPLNQRFKELCTRWQLRGGVANDHGDHTYDRDVVATLQRIHDDIDRHLSQSAFERTAWYQPRLRIALNRLAAGDLTALTRPLSESYHDVWMELHQDLIVSLGITRTDADA